MIRLQYRNDISEIPIELGANKVLHTLNVEGLNIKKPPEVKAILQKGNPGSDDLTPAIMQSLRNSLLDPKPYRGVKLIVMGPEVSYVMHA